MLHAIRPIDRHHWEHASHAQRGVKMLQIVRVPLPAADMHAESLGTLFTCNLQRSEHLTTKHDEQTVIEDREA